MYSFSPTFVLFTPTEEKHLKGPPEGSVAQIKADGVDGAVDTGQPVNHVPQSNEDTLVTGVQTRTMMLEGVHVMMKPGEWHSM